MTRLRLAAVVMAAALAGCQGDKPVAPPPVPSRMLAVSGDGQSAPAGTRLRLPFAVKILDQNGRPMEGRTVTFQMVDGTGALDGSLTTTTTSEGVATGPTLILAKLAGTQRVRALSDSLSYTFTVSAASSYGIEVRFVGTAPADVQEAFLTAARRINAVVVGALPTVAFQGADLGQCATWLSGSRLSETVGGLIVYATTEPIDGPGKVLASAGPCLARVPFATDARPVVGTMRFDTADLDNLRTRGQLLDVILHEMLHVVGIGTIWGSDARALLQNPSTTTQSNDSRFTGPLATEACRLSGGLAVCGSAVPVENDTRYGEGTLNGHWREAIFRNELMTGIIEPLGVVMPFSTITAQALADLSYLVNPNAVDAYTVPSAPSLLGWGAERTPDADRLELGERLLPLAGGVDRSGRVTRLPGATRVRR